MEYLHSNISFLLTIFQNLKTDDNTTTQGQNNTVGETFLGYQMSPGHPSQPPICETEICRGEEFDFEHLPSDCSNEEHVRHGSSVLK